MEVTHSVVSLWVAQEVTGRDVLTKNKRCDVHDEIITSTSYKQSVGCVVVISIRVLKINKEFA